MTSPDDETREIIAVIDNDEIAWRMMKAAGIDVPGVVNHKDTYSGRVAMKYIEQDDATRAWRWRQMARTAAAYVIEQFSEQLQAKYGRKH